MAADAGGNRLAHAASPYLRQHADNPVAWQPWSEAAFAEARLRNKPVLVSIGYSTCHWCHVMEEESFSDPEVAAVLNRVFVCIKVDREERPDLDALYMQAAQALTGRGGWPLNVLLTPEKRPFYAFTYLPKEDRFGRIGLISLATRIEKLWREDRTRIERSAASLSRALERAQTTNGVAPEIGAQTVDAGYRALMERHDDEYGGFGEAPKFPSPHQLLFLFRHGALAGRPEAIRAAIQTLHAMRRGGIHDHVGGGFHRYATDRAWHLPHFEKMLHDQALLLLAYTEGWQLSGEAALKATAEDIVGYLLRRMQAPEGAFYTAEDADSEGEEGRHYVWSTREIRALLPAEEAEAVIRAFGMQDRGNYADEASGRRTGMNVLDLVDEAALAAIDWPEVRARLLASRQQRPLPFRDEKILGDWNGLAIAALATAGRAMQRPDWLHEAERAADFVLAHLWRKDALLHRWFRGQAGIAATLDDYAFLAWGMLALHQATLDARWLQAAIGLADAMLARFAAPGGGLYLATGTDLIVRPIDAFDGALPSGNAVAMHVLVQLGRVTGDSRYDEAAAGIVRRFAAELERAPQGMLHLLAGIEIAHAPSLEIVLAGPSSSTEARAMRAIIDGAFRPNVTVLRADAASKRLVAFLRAYDAVDGRATAYVCEYFRCHAPTTDAAGLERLLQAGLSRPR